MLHIEISKALKRKFDSSSGKEIEPNYGKDKKVSTGYLMSSYSKTSTTIFFFIPMCSSRKYPYLPHGRDVF